MASTYSPNLRLELIGTGEQQGSWGATTNVNLGTLLEEAIGGYVSVTVSDVADTTLTANNGSADQSRNMVLNLTGALTATRNVICPAIEKVYIVKNATTGSQSVVFKVSGQTGVTITNGSTVIVYVDGTDVRQVTATTGTIASQNSNSVSITGGSITGLSDLNVANATVASTVRTNLGLGSIATQNANAVAITGGSVVANASSLSIRDADASNILTLAVGSNLTANTTLTLTTGTSSRTLDISASNVTVSTAGAALIDDADAAAQRTTLGLGTAATQNTGTSANNVVQLDSSAKLPAVDGSQLTGLSSPTILTALSLSNTQTFNASGTWTKPGSGTYAIVRCWGAGGGGRSGAGGTTIGGGGGGFHEQIFLLSSLTSTVTATVGLGGNAGSGAAGASGGNTTFGSYLTAYGGAGGSSSSASSGAGGGSGSAGSGATGGNSATPVDYAAIATGTMLSYSNNAPSLAAGLVTIIANIKNGTGANGVASGSIIDRLNSTYGGGGGGFPTGGDTTWGGGGGGGGSSGVGGAGGTSTYGGNGGTGAVTGTATAGSQPGGGGGSAYNGTGAKGGDGRIVVYVY